MSTGVCAVRIAVRMTGSATSIRCCVLMHPFLDEASLVGAMPLRNKGTRHTNDHVLCSLLYCILPMNRIVSLHDLCLLGSKSIAYLYENSAVAATRLPWREAVCLP